MTSRDPDQTDFLDADDVDPFTMLPDWVLDRTDLSHGAFRAYALLRSYLRRGGRVAFPSRATLAARMGLAKPASVDRFLLELESAGMIRKSEHSDAGPNGGRLQRSNRYLLAIARPLSPYRDGGSPHMGTGVVPKQGHEADELKQTNGSTHVASATTSLDVEVETAPRRTKAPVDQDPESEDALEQIQKLFLKNRLEVRIDSVARRTLARLLTKPGATLEEIVQVARYGTTNDFWRSKVRSFPLLAKHFDSVRLQVSTTGPARAIEPAPVVAPLGQHPLVGDEEHTTYLRARALLARGISPARYWEHDGDSERWLRRALAKPVRYSDLDLGYLAQAWSFRGEGGWPSTDVDWVETTL